MSRQGANQIVRRQISPKEALFVSRLLSYECALVFAIGRTNVVQNFRCGFVDDFKLRPMQAERQVHVLEVRCKRLRKSSDLDYRVPSIEGAGAAGAKHSRAIQ